VDSDKPPGGVDGGSKVEEGRLRAELEDLTMAIDMQQVYTKIKCRVTAFNVMHHTKPM